MSYAKAMGGWFAYIENQAARRRQMARSIERSYREQGHELAGDGGWKIGDRVEVPDGSLTSGGGILEMEIDRIEDGVVIAETRFGVYARLTMDPEETEALRLPQRPK